MNKKKQFEKEKLEGEGRDEVERRYALICSRALPLYGIGLQCAVENISRSEELTKSDFTCTQDMREKVWAFLTERAEAGNWLKQYRQSKGYSSEAMRGVLGVSREFLSRMESGSKPLNAKALSLAYEQWYNETHV